MATKTLKKAGNMRLEYDDTCNTLFVESGHRFASLACAANEGELTDQRGNAKPVSAAQHEIIHEWQEWAFENGY